MQCDKTLDALEVRFRNLAQSTRSTPVGASKNGGLIASLDSRGGFRLQGRVAGLFRECLELLLQVHPKEAHVHVLSRTQADQILSRALLGVLHPRQPDDGSKAAFDERIAREVAALRSQLTTAPRVWKVAHRVLGIRADSLPFTFGTVEFSSGEASASQIAKLVPTATRGVRPGREGLATEHKIRRKGRAEIRAAFRDNAVATTAAQAMDSKAAVEIALERTRRAVDVINFFVPYFQEGLRAGPVLVAPAGKRIEASYAVWAPGQAGVSWSRDWYPYDYPAVLTFNGSRAQEVGFARAHEIAKAPTRNSLEDRILSALSWAGRATVEPRADQSLMLYAIALEGLLGNHKARGGVTDRLRLRVVHLIGKTPQERRQLSGQFVDLYQLRSGVVHSGTALVSDTDLRMMSFFAEQALRAVLTEPEFIAMTCATIFQKVLDERALG